MLVVKVEVWPGGDLRRAFEIARIGAANVSRLASVSDYEVVALLGEGEDKEVVRSHVGKHERAAGWMPLVRRILTNLMLRKELTSEASPDDPMAVLLREEKKPRIEGPVSEDFVNTRELWSLAVRFENDELWREFGTHNIDAAAILRTYDYPAEAAQGAKLSILKTTVTTEVVDPEELRKALAKDSASQKNGTQPG